MFSYPRTLVRPKAVAGVVLAVNVKLQLENFIPGVVSLLPVVAVLGRVVRWAKLAVPDGCLGVDHKVGLAAEGAQMVVDLLLGTGIEFRSSREAVAAVSTALSLYLHGVIVAGVYTVREGGLEVRKVVSERVAAVVSLDL